MTDASVSMASMASTGTKKKKIFKRLRIRRKKKKNHPDDESQYSFGSSVTGGEAKQYNKASANNHDSIPTIPETISENVGESSSFHASGTGKPVRLVLLLVDPKSRRFGEKFSSCFERSFVFTF